MMVGRPDPGLATPGVAQSVKAARDYLLRRQESDGFWKGELRTNVTMDAEDLLLRQFLGILRPDDLEHAGRWIRSQQRGDGTWANFEGGPADLSTTIEAYVALRLAGDALDSEPLTRAREFILANGGIEASRVFTRIWLALFGEWSWDELPVMPPEIIRLPRTFPLNVYNWGCWARQTIVALAVVVTLRPTRPLGFSVSELLVGGIPAERQPAPTFSLARAFQGLDKVLHRYEQSPIKPGRTAALQRCIEWILARQEADGGWGGIQPPWVYSILALHLSGYSLEHPAVRAAVDGLEGFIIREETPAGTVRRLEACQSPVWDTCLAVVALSDGGLAADDPAMVQAGQWLLNEQVNVDGDWSVRRPDLVSGGWAFEFANDRYPDIDDTAEVLLALRRVDRDSLPGRDEAMKRGLEWMIGMQSSDGGWGAFDADNNTTLMAKLPFSDFGALSDPASSDVTAHVLESMAALGRANSQPAKRGLRWLLREQEEDGSWYGRWGANHIYGTGAVIPALTAMGVSTDSIPVRRAVEWLHQHQNADGGWGEDLRSYTDPQWRGRGESTPSQTAWALLALLAAEDDSNALHRGAQYLMDTQSQSGPDRGGWSEDLFTGTGFPGFFYINYEMYRHVFPLSALGRYAQRFAADQPEPPIVSRSRVRRGLSVRGPERATSEPTTGQRAFGQRAFSRREVRHERRAR